MEHNLKLDSPLETQVLHVSKPLISVIIPTHNSASFLAETLTSVQSQTFHDFEVIVVDDSSTDESVAIAKSFCEKDSRFRLIQMPACGVSDARNAGILDSKAQWIAFLDSDDVWLPKKLERQVQLSLDEPKANLLFTNHLNWDGKNILDFEMDKKRVMAQFEF